MDILFLEMVFDQIGPEAPVLFIHDPRDENELYCGSSSHGFGAILLQRKGDRSIILYFIFQSERVK